jgi:hypothetical protein
MEGSPPAADDVLFRWNGRYGLALGRAGDRWLLTSALDCAFAFDESASTISCIVRDQTDPGWLDVLVRRILPRVAMRHGAVAVHAAAAARNGRAMLLLGASGAGKSTTSAALGAAGWDVLSDDISIVWDHADPHVAPATTGICVWADSHAALDLPLRKSVAMPGYSGKRRYVPGFETNTAPVSLEAIILLERSDGAEEPSLVPVPCIEALGSTTRQRIRFNPADTSGEELQETFAALSAIVENTRCYRLSYPSNYDALPAVVERLRELLEN